jgi:hypothetical protein
MNLAIVVYTNETNLPILRLFLDYFFKHNPNFDLPIYVVGNKFTISDLPHSDKVRYLAGDVEFDSIGGHFSKTLRNVLPQIEEDYIFYFCEDYILTDPIDITGLNNLIKLMNDENIDLFSFASSYANQYNRPLFNIDYSKYGFEDNIFHHMDPNYQHAFSIQPCVWKKSSLIQLLQDNPNINPHELDCSELANKEHYKIICTKYYIYDLAYPAEYFIIGYKEIIRHGVFLMDLNGHETITGTHGDTFVKQLIKENNLLGNPEYDKYIGFDKSLFIW